MRLEDLPTSSNVSDQRGMRTAGGIAAGGGGILLLILGLVFGVDTSKLGVGDRQSSGPPPNDKYGEFAAKVVGTLESVWQDEFNKPANGYRRRYENAKLRLFSDGVKTGGCGFAPAEVGPFYCPGDKTMYLDPTFFDELEAKLGGSKAQFSQAYVIAHENGHHVQNLLGFSARVDDKRGTRQENEYSLRLELQADYLAGVWAHQAQKKFNFIEPGDVESALTSAKAIGDDRLQKRSSGFVHPEKFNHGTSRQRVAAFDAGFRSGDASMAKLDKFFTVRFDQGRGELDDSLFR
jgi:predicted metalloprotease